MTKRPKTGGRKKGTLNKVTAELKALTNQYGEEAVLSIVKLAREAENEQTRLAAWKELLDRGWGKPAQAVVGDNDQPVAIEIIRRVVDPKQE